MEIQSRSTLWRERGIGLLLVAWFIFGYLPINAFNKARGVYHILDLPGEEGIPFVSVFILGYLLVYGSIVWIYWLVPSWEIFKKVAWAFFWVTTAHYLVFLLFPVKMIWRPEITDPQNFFELLSQGFFYLDEPFNCFPSLHVAYPTLAAVFAWRYFSRFRRWFFLMALLTAVSVVLIKQHYILDAVGGVATALLIGVWITSKKPAAFPFRNKTAGRNSAGPAPGR